MTSWWVCVLRVGVDFGVWGARFRKEITVSLGKVCSVCVSVFLSLVDVLPWACFVVLCRERGVRLGEEETEEESGGEGCM